MEGDLLDRRQVEPQPRDPSHRVRQAERDEGRRPGLTTDERQRLNDRRVLPIAPSTYYAARAGPPSNRALRDEYLKAEIRRVYEDNRVYGADKIWTQLNREGIKVARCTVERLMREMGIQGARRGGEHRTTIPADDTTARPQDLVQRAFSAPAPNRLWLCDIERHEALLDRMEMGGLHPWAVAAAREKLGAA